VGRPQSFDTEEAIDKAMHLFWERGYARTTPQLLTDELGIGKGSLYHLFGSKHELFLLALQRYYDNRADAITRALAAEGPLLPRLREIMATFSGVGAHRRGCLVVNTVAELADTDRRVSRTAADLFGAITAELTRAVEQGRASGEFSRDTDPPEAARSLLNNIIGTSVQAKLSADHRKLLQAIDESLEALSPIQTARENVRSR
jgi:TetR/AcrR family transcriptional regulator, transcriptional repressor for nem operon